MGLLETHHERAKLGKSEPFRHLLAQDAAAGAQTCRPALACDDEDKSQAVVAGAQQEIVQRSMGAGLCHAVQIDPRLDVLFAT